MSDDILEEFELQSYEQDDETLVGDAEMSKVLEALVLHNLQYINLQGLRLGHKSLDLIKTMLNCKKKGSKFDS